MGCSGRRLTSLGVALDPSMAIETSNHPPKLPKKLKKIASFFAKKWRPQQNLLGKSQQSPQPTSSFHPSHGLLLWPVPRRDPPEPCPTRTQVWPATRPRAGTPICCLVPSWPCLGRHQVLQSDVFSVRGDFLLISIDHLINYFRFIFRNWKVQLGCLPAFRPLSSSW